MVNKGSIIPGLGNSKGRRNINLDTKSDKWGGKRVKKVGVEVEQWVHEDAKEARYSFISNAMRIKQAQRSNDVVADNENVESQVPVAAANFNDEQVDGNSGVFAEEDILGGIAMQ